MITNVDGEILSDDIETPGVFLRTPYNYDTDRASERAGISFPEPSLAVQDARDDADINVIVERFGLTGQMPILERIPIQAEFVPVTTYQEAIHQLQEADRIFMTLPAKIRKEFDNDPGQFLEFTSDDKNRAKMEEWGMLKPKDQPTNVFVVNPQETPGK